MEYTTKKLIERELKRNSSFDKPNTFSNLEKDTEKSKSDCC